MLALSVVVFILYTILLTVFWIGVDQSMRDHGPKGSQRYFLSVIIPVRNEEHTIGALLNDLLKQDYRNFEVICVDDHSEDDTAKVIAGFSSVQVKYVTTPGAGKKMALAAGIALAQGDIVVTTDADCRVGTRWLSTINRFFQRWQTQMVIGAVTIKESGGLFSRLQQLEFASLMGSTLASAGLHLPITCNGANLSFRKSAYQEVDGYAGNFGIASGDDEFLMRKVRSAYPRSVVYCHETDALVATRPHDSLRALYQQRIRWAGKWGHNSSISARFVAILVFVTQLATVYWLLRFITTGEFTSLALAGGRLIFDFVIMRRFCRELSLRFRIVPFLILSILYPFYVIAVAISSLFVGYQWKGRNYGPDTGFSIFLTNSKSR
jgi:biofilm PGA synthesis N-glycosyltransferase PgaC